MAKTIDLTGLDYNSIDRNNFIRPFSPYKVIISKQGKKTLEIFAVSLTNMTNKEKKYNTSCFWIKSKDFNAIKRRFGHRNTANLHECYQTTNDATSYEFTHVPFIRDNRNDNNGVSIKLIQLGKHKKQYREYAENLFKHIKTCSTTGCSLIDTIYYGCFSNNIKRTTYKSYADLIDGLIDKKKKKKKPAEPTKKNKIKKATKTRKVKK